MFGFIGDDDIDLTYEILSKHGLNQSEADTLLHEGYYLRGINSFRPSAEDAIICDSFYGSGLGCALHPLDDFLSGNVHTAAAREIQISSSGDLIAYLDAPEQARLRDRICFRGQGREYVTQRGYPNPALAVEGQERLIIPAYWRHFKDDWHARFKAPEYRSIFTDFRGDDLIYHGIPDYRALGERNAARYGPHSIGDLEDFPDWESQEYHRRWYAAKIVGHYSRDPALIEQHYGIDTTGLDVTFDPLMAEFFATNRFVSLPDGRAKYEPTARGGHQGVIYCMVFGAPTLKRSADMVRGVGLFDHIPPTRPFRQSCALPFFNAHDFNNAVCHLHCVLRLSEDYQVATPLSPSHVFPSVAEDPFYAAALEVKHRYGDRHSLAKIVEYELD
jgi:hypothetical protein